MDMGILENLENLLSIRSSEYDKAQSLIKTMKSNGYDIKMEDYTYGIGDTSSFVFSCNGQTATFKDNELGYQDLQNWLLEQSQLEYDDYGM